MFDQIAQSLLDQIALLDEAQVLHYEFGDNRPEVIAACAKRDMLVAKLRTHLQLIHA